MTASIPRDIREAMTEQMVEVLESQQTRAEDCRLAGQRAVAGSDLSSEQVQWEVMRAEYRCERAFWNEGGPAMAETRDTHIRAAGVDVPVRIHRPIAGSLLPGIVFSHGGGFVVGDLDTHDRIMRFIAAESGAAVIGVDYSLSPEVRYPQALHEVAGIVDHLAASGQSLGINGTRLALAGDSAGAMLSMGAALLLREEPSSIGADAASFAVIRALLLYYGGHGLADSGSARLFGGAWDGMGREDLATMHAEYYSSPADGDSAYVQHLEADLGGLPPTFIAAAGLDPLRDDSRALSQLLERAGTEVEFEEYAGVLHSFLHFGRILPETSRVLESSSSFVAARL